MQEQNYFEPFNDWWFQNAYILKTVEILEKNHQIS